jgi:hypothetical protein
LGTDIDEGFAHGAKEAQGAVFLLFAPDFLGDRLPREPAAQGVFPHCGNVDAVGVVSGLK